MKIFLKRLWSLLTGHDKKIFFLLIIFSVFISLMETFGITVIMPFIAVASNFDLIESKRYFSYVYHFFNFSDHISFVLAFGIVLIFFYIFRSCVNLYYFYVLSKFSKERYHHLAYRLLENYMGRSYREFIRGNTASLSKSILSEAGRLTQIFYSALLIICELFIVIFIYTIMIYTNWKITLLFSLILFINILFLLKTISPKIKNEGYNREKFQRKFYEILNTTFGNFKMIKLKSKDDIVLEKFKEASAGFALSNIRVQTLSHVPRHFLEALGFAVVTTIILLYIYQNQRDVTSAMAMISMFILGLYRLMPSANRILNSYNSMIYNYKSLNIIHNDLIYEIENLGHVEVVFESSIRLKDVSFSYTEDKDILRNISLVINKGEKCAFFGESGSGKSTLVDIIMGLYRPKEGDVFVDGVPLDESNIKDFRKKIGYIPQSIYLFDGTVAQNVAFHSKINNEKVREVLKQARLLAFLENNNEGINTQVGENGLNLSGGQKQRIAIARALYNDPDILVLDEATSSLDHETEMEIMDEIYSSSNDKTLIIISHKLNILERCEKLYKIENGAVKLVSS